MNDYPSDIPSQDPDETRQRRRRRAADRARVRRRWQWATLAAVTLIAVLVAARMSGSSTPRRHAAKTTIRTPAIIPGGPLAPGSSGGLAALWAPQNVVGAQPGTARAYEAASKLAGLPGYLMIADRGNNRILIVNPAHQIVFEYPGPAEAGRLFFDDDTFIEPGGEYVISNEEGDHAIVQVNLARRTQQVLFGEPGVPGSDSAHLHEPDDAYMLPDGTFTVADAENCRILFIRAHRIVRSYGHSAVCRHDPPAYFNQVNGDTPLPGGGVLVSEIEGNWLDEIGPEGRLLWSIRAPVSYPSDPQPLPGGRVLLADYASPGHVLILDRHGRVRWRYGPEQGYGRLDHPSLAMPLPNGDIVVNDDYRDRVVVIDPRKKRIVWQYGHTDTPGTAPGYLNTPDGLDFIPAGSNGMPDYAAVVHP
ncbi:MAG: hypothetical protein ACRDK2_01555 [Solirubrobacteraceae bacterium]